VEVALVGLIYQINELSTNEAKSLIYNFCGLTKKVDKLGLTEIFLLLYFPLFFLPKITQKKGNKKLSSFKLFPFSPFNRAVPTKFLFNLFFLFSFYQKLNQIGSKKNLQI